MRDADPRFTPVFQSPPKLLQFLDLVRDLATLMRAACLLQEIRHALDTIQATHSAITLIFRVWIRGDIHPEQDGGNVEDRPIPISSP